MSYNYVFYSVNSDYKKNHMFKEIQSLDNVRICHHAISTKNRFLKKLFRLHWSEKLNSIINLPFKWIWFVKMYRQDFRNSNPTCYIFFEGKYADNLSKFTNYIKEKDRRNITICYYLNIINKHKPYNFDIVKKNVDFVISYDPIQAQKYEVEYIEEEFYDNDRTVIRTNDFHWDVLFLGYAKDRLDLLVEICKKLTSNGISCNFILVGVSAEEQIEQEGISYSNPIPYSSYIDLIQQSRVILEIMQNGSASNTLRANEAIAYNRKLLTNQPFIKDKKIFNHKYISQFDSVNDIDVEFIKDSIDYSIFDIIQNKRSTDRLILIEKLIVKYQTIMG